MAAGSASIIMPPSALNTMPPAAVSRETPRVELAPCNIPFSDPGKQNQGHQPLIPAGETELRIIKQDLDIVSLDSDTELEDCLQGATPPEQLMLPGVRPDEQPVSQPEVFHSIQMPSSKSSPSALLGILELSASSAKRPQAFRAWKILQQSQGRPLVPPSQESGVDRPQAMLASTGAMPTTQSIEHHGMPHAKETLQRDQAEPDRT